jgi:hypothetical protein
MKRIEWINVNRRKSTYPQRQFAQKYRAGNATQQGAQAQAQVFRSSHEPRMSPAARRRAFALSRLLQG